MKRPSANRRSLRSTQALEPQPGSPVHIRQSRINDLPAIRTIARLQDTELLQQQQGVTSQPGLCFIGLSCQYTRESAVPTGVSFDAAFIAGRSRHTQGAMTMTRFEKNR